MPRILSLVSSTKEGYIIKERVTKKEVLVSHKEGISIQKPKYKLLHIASEIDFPKVRMFLESVARGSKSSKNSYEIGLKHLQCFLNTTTSNSSTNSDDDNNNSSNDYYHHYNIETILLALQSNKLNVYGLLDSFVSYFVNIPHHQHPIAPM